MLENKEINIKQYEIAIKALEAISDPITHLKAKLNEGETLSGLYIIKLLDRPDFYQNIAEKALEEINKNNERNFEIPRFS